MSRIEKLILILKEHPCSLKYADIEKILLHIGFEKKQGKGSHVKFSYKKTFFLFSPHNGEIKNYQKEQVSQILKLLSLFS